MTSHCSLPFISHTDDSRDDKRCVAVCCAVCDDMQEDLILPAAAIDKLSAAHVNDVMVESCQRNEGDDDGHPIGDHSTFRENPETYDDKTDRNNADSRSVDYGGDVSSPFVDEGRRDRDDDIDTSHVHKDTVISGDFVVTEKHARKDENESSTDHSVPADEYDADGLVH